MIDGHRFAVMRSDGLTLQPSNSACKCTSKDEVAHASAGDTDVERASAQYGGAILFAEARIRTNI